MICKRWGLFDKVSTMDGVFLPYAWAGNGLNEAYAIKVGDKINNNGEVAKYVLRDLYAECVGGISVLDLAAGGEN